MDAAKLREFEAREEGGGHSFGGRRPDRGFGRDSRSGGGNRDRRDNRSGGNFGSGNRDRGGQGHGGQGAQAKGSYTRRDTGGERSDRPQQGGHGHGGHGHQRRFERPQPPAILDELEVSIIPTSVSVAALAQQIKSSARAYPIFDVAGVILQSPERYQIRISQKGAGRNNQQHGNRKPRHGEEAAKHEKHEKHEAAPAAEAKEEVKEKAPNPFYICRLDHTPWLTESQAVRHILEKHLDAYYTAETVATEAPKGNFTFVAVCGMSGTNLGPPNHHDYQNKLRAIHAARFSHTPFEAYRQRIKTVRDEALVKAWLDEQSSRVEYVSVKRPEDDRLKGKGEVEAHFRTHHMGEVIYRGSSVTLSKPEHVKNLSQEIGNAVRWTIDDQKRFPISMVNLMRMEFNRHGLHVFKLSNKDNVTYVGVARPRRIDLVNTPMAVGVRKIVDWLLVTPKATRQTFLHDFAGVTDESLKAAAHEATVVHPAAPAEAPAPAATEAAATEQVASEAPAEAVEASAPAEAPAADAAATTEAAPAVAQAPAAEARPQLTAEQMDALRNLRWLMYEGYVVELSNGTLFTPQPNSGGQNQQQNNGQQKKAAVVAQAAPVAAAAVQEAQAEEAPAASEPVAAEVVAEQAAPVEQHAAVPAVEAPETAVVIASVSPSESDSVEAEATRDEEVGALV
ncbi:hypothetical protein DB346_20805 [Verrucomicrobia bacterium LW23]|nr:hypothetical protein DB346_20805 [Verrucomicrobia bacterium LW23]